MPIPPWMTQVNKRFLNRGMRLLVGFGPLSEIETVGRRSGQVHRTVVTAFRDGDSVVIALFYGPKVDWLQNLTVAGKGRLRLGKDRFRISGPSRISKAAGMARMPVVARFFLPVLGVDQFVEVKILTSR